MSSRTTHGAFPGPHRRSRMVRHVREPKKTRLAYGIRRKGFITAAAEAMVVNEEKRKEALYRDEAKEATRSGNIVETAIWYPNEQKLRERMGVKEYRKVIETLLQLHAKDPHALTNPVDEIKAQRQESRAGNWFWRKGTIGVGAVVGGVTAAVSNWLQGKYFTRGVIRDARADMFSAYDQGMAALKVYRDSEAFLAEMGDEFYKRYPYFKDQTAENFNQFMNPHRDAHKIVTDSRDKAVDYFYLQQSKAHKLGIETDSDAPGVKPHLDAIDKKYEATDASSESTESGFWDTIKSYVGAGERGARTFLVERPWLRPALLGVVALGTVLYYKKRAFEKDLNKPSREVLKRDEQYWVNIKKREDTCTQQLQLFRITLNKAKVLGGASSPFERLDSVRLKALRDADPTANLSDIVIEQNVAMFNKLLEQDLIGVHGFRVQIVSSAVKSSWGGRLTSSISFRSHSYCRRRGRLFS